MEHASDDGRMTREAACATAFLNLLHERSHGDPDWLRMTVPVKAVYAANRLVQYSRSRTTA